MTKTKRSKMSFSLVHEPNEMADRKAIWHMNHAQTFQKTFKNTA